ncbi:MAG: CBS domain-containing protein [Ignavibacteriae bacterium]|nr:CBS domain-containing protein [Ignavibacteriota bacterium]NOG96566.1 CBS domain-containing protein [Ignavibacteriota bacterium]
MNNLVQKYFPFLIKLRNIRIKFQNYLSNIAVPDYTLFSFFAILTGALAGLAAVFFHHSIDFFNKLFFEQTTEGLFFLGTAAVIVLPALGMLIQSIMIYASPIISKRRGVAEVIKSVTLRGGYIPFRTTLFHFFAPVICIGSGGTVGPEGPAAQLGGGVASKMGNLFGLSDARRRMFTAAGSGAAIAAIFNTPLGGIFFALEVVLLNDFQSATFSALILASVTASAISRIFLGDASVFTFSIPEIVDYNAFYFYAIFGIITGIISLLFISYSTSSEKYFSKVILKKFPQWAVMVAVGLIVGACGYFYKEIFGIGYTAINLILSGSLTWKVVLVLLAMKFILVPLILHSGGFGGLFAPSLFMGACVGFLFAFGINSIWGTDLDITTFVLVGMGAMLGGINSIPISAILIIFEMTKEYSFILPLMLVVVISTTIVQLVLKGSVHVKHLENEGYRISSGRETNLLRTINVDEVQLEKIMTVKEGATLPELVSKLLENPQSTFYTVNNEGKITGVITENELRPIISEYENLKDVILARDIANNEVIKVFSSNDLDYVLRLFGKKNLDEFLVVSSKDHDNILGAITRQDVISVYNKESFKHNIADNIASELMAIEKSKVSRVADGYSITEKKAVPSFVGKSLVELRIRNKYGLEVLMIKQSSSPFSDDTSGANIITPDPNYKIQRDDTLVLFGSDENIKKVDNW